MRKRLTTWLSALLVFNAVFCLPVVRVATNRVSCSVVYSENRKHHNDRDEELAPALRRPRPVRAEFTAIARDLAGAPLLDFSLFQRPPPALS